MSFRSAASPSARTAARATTLAPACWTNVSIARMDSPVEMTSSRRQIFLPRILSASTPSRYRRCISVVVMELTVVSTTSFM